MKGYLLNVILTSMCMTII